MTVDIGAIACPTGFNVHDIAREIQPATTPLINRLPRQQATCDCPVRSWQAVASYWVEGREVKYHQRVVEMDEPDDPWRAETCTPDPDWLALIAEAKAAEECGVIEMLANFALDYQTHDKTGGASVLYPVGRLVYQHLQSGFLTAFNNGHGDPDVLVLSPSTAATLDVPAALAVGDPPTHVVNTFTGREVELLITPHCPDDMAMALSLTLPYRHDTMPHGIYLEVRQDYWAMAYDPQNYAGPEPIPTARVMVRSVPHVTYTGGLILWQAQI